MSFMSEPKLPTRSQAFVFNSKVKLLRARRTMENVIRPVPKLTRADSCSSAIAATSVTPLWSEADPAEQRLQFGKVHNLRLACREIDGLQLRTGDVFSFWRHLGNPSQRRGFVAGRQIQEGCVIPAIAGGICQLSNALYS